MLSFIPQDVLHEIWDLIESVSEGSPTYSYNMWKNMDVFPFNYMYVRR